MKKLHWKFPVWICDQDQLCDQRRVLAAAVALGYQPTARSDGKEDTDRPVAIIMANLLSPYFAELGDRLIDELSLKGLRPRLPRIWLGCDIVERDTTRGIAPPPSSVGTP